MKSCRNCEHCITEGNPWIAINPQFRCKINSLSSREKFDCRSFNLGIPEKGKQNTKD